MGLFMIQKLLHTKARYTRQLDSPFQMWLQYRLQYQLRYRLRHQLPYRLRYRPKSSANMGFGLDIEPKSKLVVLVVH